MSLLAVGVAPVGGALGGVILDAGVPGVASSALPSSSLSFGESR